MASFKAIGNPRYETLTGADVLGLIAIGLCFGVALVGFMRFFLVALNSREQGYRTTRAGIPWRTCNR
jgi:hypothetical protein